MKKLYSQILFLIVLSWQYAGAQTPVISWPLNQSNQSGTTQTTFTPESGSSTAQLFSLPGSTAAVATFGDDLTGSVSNDHQVLWLGTSQYLQLTDFFGAFGSTIPYAVPENITISFWMFHTSTDNTRRAIFSGGDGLGLDIEDNTLILKRKESYRDATSEFPIVESTPVFTRTSGGQWYFVTLSYSEYFFKIYIGENGYPDLACSYQWMGNFLQNWSAINRTTDFVMGSKKSGINSVQGIYKFKVFDQALRREQVSTMFLKDTYYEYDIQVYKNDALQSSVITDALVGDKIKFVVTTGSATKPIIENLPQTWIARFSGDFRYFVDASHKPGASKPWIGFDTQVHWLNLRNFEQEADRVNYPDWTSTSSGTIWTHTFTYIVNTPMKNYTSAPAKYQWDKFSLHRNSSGNFDKHMILSTDQQVWLQRANQKEGLNMQLLHYWNWSSNTWQNADYTTGYSGATYMMGFDDDEILYANTRNYIQEGGGRYAILKEPLTWQTVPTKETASSDETVNSMVSAYYQSRSEYPQGKDFLGSELMDYNTTDVEPEGTGTWMHENGNVTITVPPVPLGTGQVVYEVGINAESPLKKFYSITGPTVVGRNEVLNFVLDPFTGVNPKAVINNYIAQGYEVTFEYETQDSFGSLKRDCDIPAGGGTWTSASGERTGVCTHQVYSTIDIQTKNTVGSNPFSAMTDNTSLTFSIKAYTDSYCSVSMYLVKRDADPTKTIRILLAGKEIIPVNLAFLEDQNLVNGTGEGGFFFIEQQRNVQTTSSNSQANGPFSVPRGDKWVTPFVRTYTFYQDQSSNWKVWDSDPHMLAGDAERADHDWYQSNKKLAARVTDQEIETGGLVKYYFGLISTYDGDGDGYLSVSDPLASRESQLGPVVSSTRFWEVDWSTYPAGEYQLTAMFRNGPPIQHKIIVKATRSVTSSPMASVKSYPLSAYDKALLKVGGMTLADGTDYKVLEVQELSSRLMFLIGERNNYQNNLTNLANALDASSSKLNKVNRWGPYNDYNARFYWFDNSGPIATPALFSFVDQNNSWNADVSNEVTNQNVSDKNYDRSEATRFPTLWGNHFSSLWKGQGPDGQAGPSYLHTASLPDESDAGIAGDFATAFGSLSDDDYWQFRATLNSWSDSYGYRMRYNPSHIYDLRRVFDADNGAFSGAAVPMQYLDDKKSKSRQPYPSDNFLNLQAWYYDLLMGRKIIVTSTVYAAIEDEIKLYNDYNVEYGKLGDATAYATTNKITYASLTIDAATRHTIPLCLACTVTEVASGSSGSRLIAVADPKDDVKIDQEFTPSLAVYPNPVDVHEKFSLDVTATQLSPLYVAVYDLTGRMIYEESSVVNKGVNQFILNFNQLGIYTDMVVVRVMTSELNESRKVIVTRSSDRK